MLTLKKLLKNIQTKLERNSFKQIYFTPHLYDYEKLVRSFPTESGVLYRINEHLGLVRIYVNNPDLSGVSTMLQIRNLPSQVNAVIGGDVYVAGMSGQGSNLTIQGLAGNNVYIRPNATSENFPNPASPGWFTASILCHCSW